MLAGITAINKGRDDGKILVKSDGFSRTVAGHTSYSAVIDAQLCSVYDMGPQLYVILPEEFL